MKRSRLGWPPATAAGRHAAAALTAALALVLGATRVGAETRALIAAGLGGEPVYQEAFIRHAERLARRLSEVSDDVTLLTGADAASEPLHAAFDSLSSRLNVSDTLLFAYVGHGSWDGERFRFNVPGRDFTATDLKRWLDAAPARRQVVIATGASSGAIQDALAADDRTVLTGTRSGEQRNATVFGAYFTAALEEDAADVDKDKRITALEAFHYAESGVARYYAGEGEMSTEHPRSGGPESRLVLAVLENQPTVDPALAHLYAQRDALELDIAALRDDKDTYAPDEYFAELQRLLLELATVTAQLDAGAELDAATEPGATAQEKP